MPPHAIPMNARPTISITTFEAVISKTHPIINGSMINNIVFRRPIELMMNPMIKQTTAAPMFSIELISAHSKETDVLRNFWCSKCVLNVTMILNLESVIASHDF